MDYLQLILDAQDDAERLEDLYQQAVGENHQHAFREAMSSCYQGNPENILLAAWHYRFRSVDARTPLSVIKQPRQQWWLAVVMGLLTGLVYWGLSDPDLIFLDHLPYVVLLWAPIAAVFVMGFLVLASQRYHRRAILMSLALVLVCAYVLLLAPTQRSNLQRHYLDQMVFHLPLLAFIGVGVTLVGLREDVENRFAYLIKSLEVVITGGLFGIAGMIFAVITFGMFDALGVYFPEWIPRLGLAGGAGMIPLLAVVSIFDPASTPINQDFSQGLSRLIATMMRILLPITLGVLLLYIVFIPFNFMGPFENRNVLIIYNAMLFAIMALVVGITPIRLDNLSARLQASLRWGIIAVAILAIVVSAYALAAIVFRTIQGGMTINRLSVIGWNSINIITLILLVFRQRGAGRDAWLPALHSVFSTAAYGYVAWGLFIVVATPLLFR